MLWALLMKQSSKCAYALCINHLLGWPSTLKISNGHSYFAYCRDMRLNNPFGPNSFYKSQRLSYAYDKCLADALF